MSFRFFKRVRILPGVGLNFGTHGASVSVGPRGFKLTFSPRGVRGSVGLPGTGMFYSFPVLTHEAAKPAPTPTPPRRSEPVGHSAPVAPAQAPQPTPAADVIQPSVPIDTSPVASQPAAQPSRFEKGIEFYRSGNLSAALERFTSLPDDPSAQFAAAAIFFQRGYCVNALEHATQAHQLVEIQGHVAEGSLTITLAITEEVSLEIAPTSDGIVLLAAEICQQMGKFDQAMQCLRELLKRDDDNVIIKLSLAELLYDTATNEDSMHEIVRLGKRIEPTDVAAIGLLLYKARALYKVRMNEGIPAMLMPILNAGDPLPHDLTLALRYQIGLAHEALGQADLARQQFSHIYAEDADYEDVAKKTK